MHKAVLQTLDTQSSKNITTVRPTTQPHFIAFGDGNPLGVFYVSQFNFMPYRPLDHQLLVQQNSFFHPWSLVLRLALSMCSMHNS